MLVEVCLSGWKRTEHFHCLNSHSEVHSQEQRIYLRTHISVVDPLLQREEILSEGQWS